MNLQAIIGWMPRDPWVAVLTDEELNAIRFAMRPAPPIEELRAAKVRGEFLVHDPFGEANLRSYLVANRPELLVDPELHAAGAHNPLQERIRKTEKARADPVGVDRGRRRCAADRVRVGGARRGHVRRAARRDRGREIHAAAVVDSHLRPATHPWSSIPHG